MEIYAIKGVATTTKSGSRQQGKASIHQILDEATRSTPDGHKHLIAQGLKPKPPVCLWGLTTEELWPWFQEHKVRASENRVPYSYRGRDHSKAQPVTWPTLLGEVASYPGAPDDTDVGYVDWKRLCLARLHEVYGERLVTVMEHLDEGHGHLHALVANPDASPVKALHPGHGPSDACLALGGTYKDAQQAYIAGLQRFQELFSDLVGRPAGLERTAPDPRRRYSYAEAQVRKQMAEEIAVIDANLAGRAWSLAQEREAFEADFMRRVAEVELREENAMAMAFRETSAKVEAKFARRQKEQDAQAALLETERAALVRDRAVLDAGLSALTEKVRAISAEAKERVAAALAQVDRVMELVERRVDQATLELIRRDLAVDTAKQRGSNLSPVRPR
ncbi:hypothetical protein [Rhodoferax sp. OV413]|uniref:hypothetical protein n=1 Tax=Rhodoferax sp. OV413 TaxID=1855285 RepID=UPI00115F7A31|nr:hypothetical protein [Rhodoferax sp. OV413]